MKKTFFKNCFVMQRIKTAKPKGLTVSVLTFRRPSMAKVRYLIVFYTCFSILLCIPRKAKQLSVPKNKLIERALSLYLDQLNRAEYAKSYNQMAKDTDLLALAEEGMMDYLQQLPNEQE